MAELNLELFSLVFFWFALWSIINIVMQWFFVQIGIYHNQGTAVIIYALIVAASLFVLDTSIKERKDKEGENNKENNNGR